MNDNLRSEMPKRKPQVGDIAHRGGLDPRRVVRVGRAVPADYDRERLCVGLQIGTVEAWPCPASNYTFTRTRLSRVRDGLV